MPARRRVVDDALAIEALVVEARIRGEQARARADEQTASWLREQSVKVEPALEALDVSAFHAAIVHRPARGMQATIGAAARLLVACGAYLRPHGSLVAAASNRKRWPGGRPSSARRSST